MFQTVPMSIIRSFSLYTQHWCMSYGFANSLRGGPSWSCSQAVSKPVWHIPLLCVHWKTPDDGQGNCLKHVVLFEKKIWEISASSWVYCENLSWCMLTWTSYCSDVIAYCNLALFMTNPHSIRLLQMMVCECICMCVHVRACMHACSLSW